MNREERLSKSLFAGLPNVKGMVAEDVRITDSPLCSDPVLEIRVRPRRGMLRCSQCGRRRRGHDQGGACVAGAVRTSAAGESSRSPRCPAWNAHGAASWSLPCRGPSPGSRFTRDFESECAWPMSVANQRTVSGFPHVAWRTAGDVAHRVAERLKASMPSPFDGLHAIGVDETSYRKGHTCITVVVDHARHRVIWEHDGYGRDVFGRFLQTLTPEQRAPIRVADGDGARWIDSCVGRWRPNAERVLTGSTSSVG